MIEKLHIESFKSLYDAELTFGNVNIFIGANGSGKTNILESIGVVSAATYGTVDDESLLRRGIRPGVPRLYKTSNKKHRTSSHIAFFIEGNECSYHVSLLNPLNKLTSKWRFKTEKVLANNKIIYSHGIKNNINPEAGGIPVVLASPALLPDLQYFFNDLQNYALYNPNTPVLRGIVSDLQNRAPVGLSGGGLAEGFQDLLKLSDTNDDLAEAIDDVMGMFNWVGNVTTSTRVSNILSASLSRQKRTIIFTDAYMNKKYNKLTAVDASEGILYILFLLVLCLSPNGPKIFAIDNVDQALNPRLVKNMFLLLQQWFQTLIPKKQIFCTVHNPAVLDALDVYNDSVKLFVVDRNSDGLTSVRQIKITEQLIKKSKEMHIPLSQMWVDGYLGGVPDV